MAIISNPANAQPYLGLDPSKSKFPIPTLYEGFGNDGYFVSESFSLANVQLPGQWLLTSVVREFGWQVRVAYGETGADILPIGDPLCVAKFAIKIWLPADAARYAHCLKTILSKGACIVPGTTSSAAMDVDQRQLNSIGIKSVVLKSVTPLFNPLVASGGRGAWTAEAEFMEYRLPIPVIKKPDQRIPDKAPPVVTAKTAVQIEDQRLAQGVADRAKLIVQRLGHTPKPNP
jgi:hypothetical protein